jgi:hypothetical protein
MKRAKGLILDYDQAGRLISMELLDASEQVRRPQSVAFALVGEDAPWAAVREKPDKPFGR